MMQSHWVGALVVAFVIVTAGAERHDWEHGWARDEPNKAGALYIMEAANASFPDNQTLVLGGVSPTTVFRIFWPYRDAGVQDTVQLLSDPSFTPQNGSWLAAPVATLFGQAQNATAVLLQINGNPALDLQSGTVTLNVSIISGAAGLKFSDGVARSTYNKALNASAGNGRSASRFAKPLSVTATVNPGAYLTNAALFLDVNQSAVTPAAVPAPPPAPAAVVQANNGFGSSITTVPGGGVSIVNNGPGGTSTFSSGVGVTNNVVTGTPVPSTPGQTPAPGTYNVVTVNTDCSGGSTTTYSYVPGLQGVQRNVNNNCG